jgi:hypothetical protein
MVHDGRGLIHLATNGWRHCGERASQHGTGGFKLMLALFVESYGSLGEGIQYLQWDAEACAQRSIQRAASADATLFGW